MRVLPACRAHFIGRNLVTSALFAWKTYAASVTPALVGIAGLFSAEIACWAISMVVTNEILGTRPGQVTQQDNEASRHHGTVSAECTMDVRVSRTTLASIRDSPSNNLLL
jgi:hypothetical protein